MFYLARNLPVILRHEKQRLYGLPQSAIYELVKESIYYIVEARADLEILIEFAAELFGDKNIFRLFSFVHQRMLSCCGFH